VLCVLAATMCAAAPASAQDVWDGGGATAGWSDGANWVDDTAPAGGAVTMSTAGRSTSTYDLASGVRLAGATFVDGPAPQLLTVNGDPIRLGSGAQVQNNRTDAGTTLVGGLAFDGDATIVQDAGAAGMSVGPISTPGFLVLENRSATSPITLLDANTVGATTAFGGGEVIAGDGSIPAASELYVWDEATTVTFATDPTLSILQGDGTVRVEGGSRELTVGQFDPTWDFGGRIVDHPSGPGSLVKTGAGLLTLTGANSYSGGTTIEGGILAGDTTSLQGDIQINSGRSLRFSQGTDGTYAGDLSGSGGLVKQGTGRVALAGNNGLFTGNTAVLGGDLAVNTAMSSAVNVQPAGTLSGTGSVGAIDVSGAVAPGTSVGTLATGAATLRSGSTYEVEIGVAGADRLVAGGPVNLGSATLDLSLLGGYTHSGGTHTIVDASAPVAGRFAGLPEGAEVTAGGKRFRISYVGGDGNDVTLRALSTPGLTAGASGNVELGNPVSDTATLAGGFSPGGTVTFRLYGPDDANCSGAPVFTDTKAVSGNGDYTSAGFRPTEVGTYRWIASYSGDGTNDAVAGACNDPNQSVTVAAQPPPNPGPDPIVLPELQVAGLERDRSEGTATLTILTNAGGNLSVEKTKKVKGFGPVQLNQAGTGDLEIVPRNRFAKKLEREGRLSVKPRVWLISAGGAVAIRPKVTLRQD
jgi:autotransporter-associated beta strand protein